MLGLVPNAQAQSDPKLTGTNSYVLEARFLTSSLPLTIDFDKGAVSGSYDLNTPVTDASNPGRQEVLMQTSTIDGTYRRGQVEFSIVLQSARTVTDACGTYKIKDQGEFTLTGTVEADRSLVRSGAPTGRHRLDPTMLNGAKKVEGQNVPPIYVVQCGGQSSGYSFRDVNLAWQTSNLKGKVGEWTAKACGPNEVVQDSQCVCPAGKTCVASTKPGSRSTLVPIFVDYAGPDTVYQRGGQGKDLPLTKGTKLQLGDIIHSLDQSVVLKIGDQLLTVYPYTGFRLEAADLTPDRIARTRVYLLDGSIKSKIPHRPAPRGDFHVPTPGANSSIRGSEMVVKYDKKTKITTVYVTEDEATIQGDKDSKAVTVPAGNKITVGADEKAGVPTAFASSELPVEPKRMAGGIQSWLWYAVGGLALAAVSTGVVLAKRPKGK
ncbi:MAG: hypothetical protein HYY50_02085 [Candidatus Kerfeldbacteria bacterium]|nr:hypothetical protein [Candidatus Kerfeldbacteria bacterium]